MKKYLSIFGFLVFSVFHFMAFAAVGGVQKSPVDINRSEITWLGKKVTGQHDGSIKIKSGEVILEGNEWKGGRLEIDMTTISNKDIKDAEKNAKLVGHLKSDDFFDVSSHPISVLEITKVKRKSESEYEATGDLTIKGIKHSVDFPIKIVVADGIASASGKVMINRTQYGIRYGSGKFFENLGDKMIDDEFEVNFVIKAKI